MSTERCRQCGWTIAERNLEMVTIGDDVIPLHKGGCPKVDDESESEAS